MRTPRLVGWFADPVRSYVDGIVASGANSISMGPYQVMSSWDASDAGSSATDAATYLSVARYAKTLGLQVVWKPIVDCDSFAGDPYVTGFRNAILPADMDLWMQDYLAKCWRPFVGVFDVAAIHTELSTMSTRYGARFIELISWLRSAGFTGPVTTSSDFNPLASPYWASLDWIGGDAYPTIRTDRPSHAVADWRGLADQALLVHAQTGCGVYFGELAANAGATQSPAQTELVWNAFWEVFGPLDWWTGFGYWRWPQDSSTPPQPLMASLAAGLQSYPEYDRPAAEAYEGRYFVTS